MDLFTAFLSSDVATWTLEFFDLVVVGMAIYSAVRGSLESKLNTYIWQCVVLVAIATIVGGLDRAFLLAILIFVARISIIQPAMAWATLNKLERDNALSGEDATSQQGYFWLARLLAKTVFKPFVQMYYRAKFYWMEYGRTRASSVWTLFACLLLIGLSYLTASRVEQIGSIDHTQPYAVGLGASLSLVLIGLFAMINERDMPSQIVGLLTMENGLFLAAAVVIAGSLGAVTYFFFTMVAYFILTLVVLAVFVPRVQASSKSHLIEKQQVLRDDAKDLKDFSQEAPNE